MLWSSARILLVLALGTASVAARAKQPAEIAGTWDLSFDKTESVCRVMLRAEQSDKGDYFLGMPTACRHAMPDLAAVGRWSMPDERHVVLGDPGGTAHVTLAAEGEGFAATLPKGTYRLTPVASGRSAISAGFTPVEIAGGGDKPAAIQPVASRPSRAEPAERSESVVEVAGRYAVMRDKRDTGCMITLDKARAAGGERAQLAPGCRDQGIVIFDPSAWQLVKGSLVLTARAGHKTRLEHQAEGQWAKDAKDGGKPLGLKKL